MKAAPWIALSAILLATPAAAQGVWDELLRMQNPAPAPPPVRAVRADDLFPPGELRRTLRTADELPAPFREAAVATNCKLENLAILPGDLVRVIIQPRVQRVFAVLPCLLGGGHIARGIYMLHRRGERADVVLLPAMDEGGRIVATPFPGALVWDLETATLTATLGSDMIPHTSFRHRYRLNGSGDGPSPLALVRVERRRSDRMQEDWQKVWEAPDWGVVGIRQPPHLPAHGVR